MSLGYYRLIRGKLEVRARQSPDGDSMRFVANDMSLFHGLPRFSVPEPGDTPSYQLRFQAIDAPELHYGGADQPQGRESRNALLTWLGVKPSAWNWVTAPKDFYWSRPAWILCDGFDSHGRPIAFVLKSQEANDGADVKLTPALLKKTYNHHAVAKGHAYLGLYAGGLSAEVRSALVAAYQSAREGGLGLWPYDRTSQFRVSAQGDLAPEGGALIYPKIFRRCVDALKWAGEEFQPGRDIDDFLIASPKENDSFVVQTAHGGQMKSRLSHVLEQINNQIKIEVDLNTVEYVPK